MGDNRSQVDIRALEQQNENLKGALISAKGIISCMEKRLEEAEIDTARLEKALQPFVEAWNARTVGPPSTAFSAGDILVRISLDHYREAAQLEAARKEEKS